MAMYNEYAFTVTPLHPLSMPSTSGGKVTAARRFKVACENAEEFALRQIGKFYDTASPGTPELPSRWPRTNGQHFSLRVSDFKIEPQDEACFSSYSVFEEVEQYDVDDPENFNQLESYTHRPVSGGIANAGCDCDCIVTLIYEDDKFECYDDSGISSGTAISVSREASYEMLTVPSRSLSWEGVDDAADKQLKEGSFGYKVIPRQDITVYWYNVPVSRLCLIDEHLKDFRGKVNVDFYALLSCGAAESCSYEPETLLFVDWTEDQSMRTRGFLNMNTTTLKLEFKYKFNGSRTINPEFGPPETEYHGWNHMILDRSGRETDPDVIWNRVLIDVPGGGFKELFTPVDFNTIFNPW